MENLMAKTQAKVWEFESSWGKRLIKLSYIQTDISHVTVLVGHGGRYGNASIPIW